MKWDKGKIIWVSVGIPILIGGVLMLIWSALTQHLGQGDRLRPSDASDSRLEDLEIGSEPPDFSVSDLEGRQIALSEFKHRKIVVLYFWATGCDLCMRAMPTIEKMHHAFEERTVEILAVNVGDDSDQVRRFSDRNKYTFRMVADEDRAIGDLFGVGEIPALVVVNRDGRVMRTRVGDSPSKADELLRAMRRLTEEPRSVRQAEASPRNEGPGSQFPKILYKVEPAYTDEAREAGIQGTVQFQVEIWEDGKLHNVHLVSGLGHGLDEKAKEVLKQWRFAPATREGRPRRQAAQIQVSFRLQGKQASPSP